MRTALSDRQCKFIDAYIDCGNATEAARRAGYRPNSARQIAAENLSKPAIRTAIAARKREISAELMLNRQDAVSGLLEAIAMARKSGNPSAMIAGWREIGRMLGFYEPETHKVEISNDLQRMQSRFTAMSDEELLAIIEGPQHPTGT